MAIPVVTQKVAQAIYEYAGKEDLPRWTELAPTIQISFIEEAEAAIVAICEHVKFLASQVEITSDEEYLIKGTMNAIAHTLDPRTDNIVR
jgi:hypothetical protein